MGGFCHEKGKFYKVKKSSGDHLDCFVSLLLQSTDIGGWRYTVQTDKHSESVRNQSDQILFCSKIRNSMCRIHFFSFFSPHLFSPGLHEADFSFKQWNSEWTSQGCLEDRNGFVGWIFFVNSLEQEETEILNQCPKEGVILNLFQLLWHWLYPSLQ